MDDQFFPFLIIENRENGEWNVSLFRKCNISLAYSSTWIGWCPWSVLTSADKILFEWQCSVSVKGHGQKIICELSLVSCVDGSRVRVSRVQITVTQNKWRGRGFLWYIGIVLIILKAFFKRFSLLCQYCFRKHAVTCCSMFQSTCVNSTTFTETNVAR